MKEVIAIIRSGKDRPTKEALAKIGCLTCTTARVYGRGKQRGLKYGSAAAGSAEAVVMRYLPKKMLVLVIRDQQLKVVVQTIIKINQTGQYGDGKIFVSNVREVQRIRTGERGEVAIR
jgi:nitrogen regulatory protein PII 2